jgi:hypothetical protein
MGASVDPGRRNAKCKMQDAKATEGGITTPGLHFEF